MIDKVEFEIGQMVYRKTMPDVAGIVTGILFRQLGCGYYVKFADDCEEHCFAIELQAEKEIAK